jgi:hypothetical protein
MLLSECCKEKLKKEFSHGVVLYYCSDCKALCDENGNVQAMFCGEKTDNEF